MHAYRTHTCGELRAAHAGETAKLSGWIHNKREHKGAIFVELRDHYGISQVVVYPTASFHEDIKRATKETVITVTGEVLARDKEAVNAKMDTGEIELRADEVIIESPADPLPLPVQGEADYRKRFASNIVTSIYAGTLCTKIS